MNDGEIALALRETWADHQLSRVERKALQELALSAGRPEEMRHRLRHAAFEFARELVVSEDAATVMAWLDEVVRAVWPPVSAGPPPSEAHFSPEEDPCGRLVRLIDGVARTLDICVFTITDDRVASAIARAHDRGVEVRIATDGDKAEDIGADVFRLQQHGVPVRYERSDVHMHHKFALFDGERLLTGSYNWTRSASRDNFENVVVLSEPALLRRFSDEFERLWALWGR